MGLKNIDNLKQNNAERKYKSNLKQDRVCRLKKASETLQSVKFRGLLFTGLFLILLSVNYISAYQRLCLTYGQSVPNEQNPRYTCWHDSCQICVTDNNYPTHPRYCNEVSGCGSAGEVESDETPPELTVNSPVDFEVYNSRSVLFNITSNEPASFYWIDNINGRGRWKRISGTTTSYSNALSLNDGLNNVSIKGIDRNGNEAEITRQFYVDSKKPKITGTSPKSGFIRSEFKVEFIEENPVSMALIYGNGINDYERFELNLESDCWKEKRKQICSTGEVDLGNYDGQNIEYWFELEDIAGSKDESRHIWLSVDESAPVLLNPSSFWLQGEGRYNKYIYFNLEIDENNFDEVTYIDWGDRRPRWKRLCSRLRDGECEVKKSFRTGHHIIDVQINDKAGNSIGERIEFEI